MFLGDKVTRSVLGNWRSADVSKKLQVTLGFLEKLTLTPDGIGHDDVAELRGEGVSERAAIDAIYVCVGFNIINRIADALGFNVPPSRAFVFGAKFLRLFGYRMLSGSFSVIKSSGLAAHAGESVLPTSNLLAGDPYRDMVEHLKESVLNGPGMLPSVTRIAASSDGQLPELMKPYVQKVMRGHYDGIERDMAALRQARYSDDEIFEATVSAALGAGLRRLEVGLNGVRNSAPALSI